MFVRFRCEIINRVLVLFLIFNFAIPCFPSILEVEKVQDLKSECSSMILKLDEETYYLSKMIDSLSQKNTSLKTNTINALRIAPANSDLDDLLKITASAKSYIKSLGLQVEGGDLLVLILVTLFMSANNPNPLLVRYVDDDFKQIIILFDRETSEIIIGVEPRSSSGDVIKILVGNRLGKVHPVYKGVDFLALNRDCSMDLQPEKNYFDIGNLLLVVHYGRLDLPSLSDNDWCLQNTNDRLCRLSTRWSLMDELQKKERLIDVATSFSLLTLEQSVGKNSINELCDRIKTESSVIKDRMDYELESYKTLSPHIHSFLENGLSVLKNYCVITRGRGQEL